MKPNLLLAAMIAAALVVAGCGDKKDKGASQTAAKVNKEEITVHQINFVLQQQRGLRPEQADAASKQILERLIDQELAIQKANELKLDRDPRVVQQLEAARREIIARSYVEKLGEGVTKPTPDEIRKYYDEKPALFKERRIYSIQEVAIEAKPDQVPTLKAELAKSKNIGEFAEWLRANDFKFVGNQAVRAAEQLPLAGLETFARMKDGEAILNPTPSGAQVIIVAGSRSQPIELQRATPAIEQFLVNERKREAVAQNVKAMREAAKIQYVGKYAEGAASAPAGAPLEPATAPVTVPGAVAPAASAPATDGALDASSISKGLGIK